MTKDRPNGSKKRPPKNGRRATMPPKARSIPDAPGRGGACPALATMPTGRERAGQAPPLPIDVGPTVAIERRDRRAGQERAGQAPPLPIDAGPTVAIERRHRRAGQAPPLPLAAR